MYDAQVWLSDRLKLLRNLGGFRMILQAGSNMACDGVRILLQILLSGLFIFGEKLVGQEHPLLLFVVGQAWDLCNIGVSLQLRSADSSNLLWIDR